ncbi:MAG TPA: tetraacyldisaccharide 4'-kinase, partial [Desulfobacteraceae bacterium]|nr:tetraacyldisaccharide 4'-kinase [Desulfobacteraceae bacterium]
MNKIKKKIETYMTDKGKRQIFSFGTILFVLSLIYGSIIRLRRIFYEKKILLPKKLPCKTISIGNLTVGGTGKTPMTIHVAHLVEKLGYKTAVISRGYKGKAEKNGGIVSDGRTIFMGQDEAGDEPFMMATKLKKVPVIVGQNRFEMGMLALKEFKPDVIIFDDAFQHLRLTRDIDLVLIDSIDPFGNKHLLPRGILR